MDYSYNTLLDRDTVVRMRKHRIRIAGDVSRTAVRGFLSEEVVATAVLSIFMLTLLVLDDNFKVNMVRHVRGILGDNAMVDISVIRLAIIHTREVILSMSSRVYVGAFDVYSIY